MVDTLKAVRAKAVIGFVGGSDLKKIEEQLNLHGQNGTRLLPFYLSHLLIFIR